MKNPFKKPTKEKERVKLFIYGESGAGKTFTSLSAFPNIALIDLERGAALYHSTFEFDVLNASTIEEIEEAIEFLRTEKHDYKTIVIDPITKLYEILTKKWSDRLFKYNKKSKGFKHEYYAMQPLDYKLLKDEWKDLVSRILSLDMNIVCTARLKSKYSEGEGEFMKKVGETFACEKDTDYEFDIVARLTTRGSNRIMQIEKDRDCRLGENQTIVNPTAELFAAAYPNLNTKSEPRRTKEQLQAIKESLYILNLKNGDLNKLCEENLKFSITGELTQEQAGKVIEMLNKKITTKNQEVIIKTEEVKEEIKEETPETVAVEEEAIKEKVFIPFGPPAGWVGDYSETEKPCPQCQKTLKFYCNAERAISKCSGCGVIFPDRQLIPEGEEKPKKNNNKKIKEEKVLCQN